ncbi:unnamed protein product [Prorocentrum cordatum]|uniref:Coiled-coil domain-containing protein 130 n=1 Tax=Prorocentrum cordatum TaxID=2364126 RepID=A0ABN9RJB2_9DINO|nr:unnamed protein product [Polarella glacialis]
MTQDITLKAAQADTFYYPPEWEPSRGSLDRFQRERGYEHHFGKSRTKNLHKGILVIRFEMPFKVQCLRCETYIGQGTRYDADKKKVGKHFSTPIYEFSMRCGCIVAPDKSADGGVHCNQHFRIRTDPQNSDYLLVEGLRRKVETWDAQDSGSLQLHDAETRAKMDTDPMFKIETNTRNIQKEKSDKERLEDLQELQGEREDSYSLNSMLRRRHRERKAEELAAEEAARRAPRPNFGVALLPPSADDAAEAQGVAFRTDHSKVDAAARVAAKRAAPILARAAARGAAAATPAAVLAAKRQRLAQHARMARLFG